ncbi:MAG TPA: hypothetical protein EYP34_04995 [Chromatiaceae bacterium]|nr:hypothetical protein [Chromatiaceae bacterium]
MNPLWILFAACSLFLPSSGMSEVLLIDAVKAKEQANITRPHRGETMDAVERHFGSPTNKHAAVGTPPITRWDYPKFSVYFEYDRVITAVLKRNKPSGS